MILGFAAQERIGHSRTIQITLDGELKGWLIERCKGERALFIAPFGLVDAQFCRLPRRKSNFFGFSTR
tara:strand:- start:312 stop:515 length:204 start_codon:yes stop_codon:yes gene_type:complete